MRVGRLYLVALGLAIVGLAGYMVIPKSKPAAPVSAAQARTMALKALQRLRLPGEFVRVAKGCSAGRCYLIAGPSTQVAARMPALLRAAGFQRPGELRADEPIAMLKAAHWSTASRDPLVIACKTVYTSSRQPLSICQDAGRIGPTLINVLVTPYRACRHHTCIRPRLTEVVTWAVALPKGP